MGAPSDEWLGCSRGGRTCKIHLCCDGRARPLSLLVTAGQCADVSHLQAVLDAIEVPRQGPGRPRKRPKALRVDRACGMPASRRLLQRRGIRCVCPERRDCRRSRLAKGRRGGRSPRFDAKAYRGRHVVERCISRLKDFRAVATRYDKRSHNFRAGVILAAIIIWI